MTRDIYYRYLKKGETCCVFLHGWGGDGNVWNFMEKPIVNRGYSFLSIDLPGHGLSKRLNKPMTMQDYAKDIFWVLNKEKINKVILLGHCFGGMVAMQYVVSFPAKVQQLVLICTSYKLPFWVGLGGLVLPIFKFIKTKPKLKQRDFTKFRGTSDLGIPRILSDINHAGTYSYYAIYRGTKNWDVSRKLLRIKKPTLIIAGKKDIVFPPYQAFKLAQKIPLSRLVFLDTNHLAPVNALEKLRQAILEDLRAN